MRSVPSASADGSERHDSELASLIHPLMRMVLTRRLINETRSVASGVGHNFRHQFFPAFCFCAGSRWLFSGKLAGRASHRGAISRSAATGLGARTPAAVDFG